MPKEILQPAEGRILISEPSLFNDYFHRSVILLADHNENGSFGIIINKPTDYKVKDVIKGFPEFDNDVFIGGPIKPDNLFVIHTLGKKIENSVKISPNLYWGGNFDTITKMISENLIQPNQIRFCVGYAGWTPNQLADEIKQKSWIVENTTSKEIFNTKPEEFWPNKMKSFGYKYAIWANVPSNPLWN